MTTWRVIVTDSESLTGVAPACEHQADPRMHSSGDGFSEADPHGVYDCCPHPHLECWSEKGAASQAATLTAFDAEVCS